MLPESSIRAKGGKDTEQQPKIVAVPHLSKKEITIKRKLWVTTSITDEASHCYGS